MDLKAFQKAVDELNYALEKMSEFRELEELPELLDEIKKEAQKIKSQKIINTTLSVFFVLSLSAMIGYLSAYTTTKNNLSKLDTGVTVVVDHGKKQVLIPRDWKAEAKEKFYVFEVK
jgi:hypothetical protein